MLDFPQVENQPFSLNFANGNFSWIQFAPNYNYDKPGINSLVFPFDANSLNFNPANFEFTDYIENGYQAGRNPNGLFDVNYYLDNNPDVRIDGGDPLTHYAVSGGGEIFDSRDPNRLFDSSYYLAKNPDVLAAGINPLLHYIQFGWRESRVDNPGGFNPNRDPSPFFDTSFYFETHVDVRDASFGLSSANALQHYLEFGNNGSVAIENRVTHPIFESESQVSFNTFVDADSASFEFLQNKINSNSYGVRVFRGDGGIRVASAFNEGGFGIGKLIGGFVYTVFSAGVFVLQKSVEGLTELSERAFEAAEDVELFERITFTPADDTIFTFPGETEGTIIVEEFPVGEPINFDDDVIFSTPLEPITELSSPNVFPQRDRILEDLLNEPFIFPDEIELPQQFLAIETNPFAAVDKNININLGTLRELKVAQIVGGFKVVEPGRPNKDLVVRQLNDRNVGLGIDVVGPNNELILVGGARKSLDLPLLKDQISRLKIIANSRNVTAQAYFASNTPEAAINLAREELGDNVIIFSDVIDQEIDNLVRLPIIKDNIDF